VESLGGELVGPKLWVCSSAEQAIDLPALRALWAVAFERSVAEVSKTVRRVQGLK